MAHQWEGLAMMVRWGDRLSVRKRGGWATAVASVLALLWVMVPAAGTPTVSGTIGVGEDPFAVVLSPDGGRAYVSNSGSGTVSVIEVASSTVVATFSIGGSLSGLAVSADGQHLYVASLAANLVHVVDTRTGSVTGSVAVPGGPMRLAISPDGARVYASLSVQGRVAVIETVSNTAIATFKTGMLPNGLVVSGDGSRLYVAEMMGVRVLDAMTGSLVTSIPVGSFPTNFALTANGKVLYVTNYSSNTVSVIDTATETVTDTLPIPGGPWAPALSPDQRSLFVVARDSDALVQTDLTAGSTVATVGVQDQPFDLVVSKDGTRVMVVNAKSDTVSVVGLRPTAPRAVTAASGDASVTVSWNVPQFNAGAAIAEYTATAAPGGRSCTSASTSCRITGLQNGVPYTVTVVAANSVGTSDPSDPSQPAIPVGRPDPPTGVSVQPAMRDAVISWRAPTGDGGRPVTGYTATVEPGAATCSTSATTCTVSGLQLSNSYRVTVTATNGVRESLPSEPTMFATLDKQMQRPVDAAGRPPRRIRLKGTTVLTGRNALTNAGQRIVTQVRARPLGVTAQGEVRYFTISRGRQGKVSIRTYGYPRLKVVLLQRAPETATHFKYVRRTVYVAGKRRA